jgi:cytochrome P450
MADEDGMTLAGVAAIELAVYASTTLDEQRARPAGDRSALVNAMLTGIDAREISTDEAIGMLMQLFTAGTETTQSLTATTIELLARDSHRQAVLRGDPSRIPEALEDVLRSDGPFQFHYRWTPNETLLGTTLVPAGSRVLLLWSAANHAVTECSGDRPAPHFAFGRGIHFCIGAALARAEARVMIEELLAGTESFRLDAEQPPTRRPSIMLRRHATLPILLDEHNPDPARSEAT